MKTIEEKYEDIQKSVYLSDLMLRLSVRLILDPKTKKKWFYGCTTENVKRKILGKTLIFKAGDIFGILDCILRTEMGQNVKNNLMIHFTEIIEEEMKNKIKNENLKIKTRKDTPLKKQKIYNI